MNGIQYMATSLPGLEEVLANEIRRKIADAHRITMTRGKVLFVSNLPIEQLLSLRTADNLYRVIGQFRAGLHRSGLLNLEASCAAADLSFVERLHSAPDNFIVNASRKGKHTFSRFEAADAAMRGIAKQYPRWRKGSPEYHTFEFRLDLEGEQALFSFRLTDSAFRFRGKDRLFSPAALRPTVAHALVWLSSPAAGDRFIDPCCGSGSIVGERLAYPAASIRGGDLSPEAVQVAKASVPAAIEQWDARHLPLDRGAVNIVVSNVPFGRQIGDRNELDGLYRELMREMSRVLQPGGRAILLAEDGALLSRAAERYFLSCAETLRLSLKGIQPAVYILKK
ncbi:MULTISPECIES: methyltransferase domain-containing protein [unclassified Paenibacillus]|uniref:methyltransferase domain-containing protein n=1 Tax=unclassified Paenibacillus TaxID=185978 RepID=UPI001C1049BA|nr:MULTISPECIES: methyltransferase domain-containing protein [unclassified Paenibacillus]MBU5442726.1 methyltransferase domain-containing protein [Paenibacillus sp. MSJ-34]CAH0120956.1 Ribosomal RNA large subunit methyltransferase K/L [Paenibacillus sp. CECT 9249]